jgi:hypothetical protein
VFLPGKAKDATNGGQVFAVAVLDDAGKCQYVALCRVMPGRIGLSFDAAGRVIHLHLERVEEGSRIFPIATAGWINVAGEKMRLGVYQESSAKVMEFAELDLDLPDVAQRLETSMHESAAN